MQSDAPDKIKQRYATLALASYPQWLFQSLQLMDRYNLKNIKQKILDRYTPVQIDESLFQYTE